MVLYADWDDYYRRAVLGGSNDMILKAELIRYSMSIKHSSSERKLLAEKAAGGDEKAKELIM